MKYRPNSLDLSENEKIGIDFYLCCNTRTAAIRLIRKLNGELRVLSNEGAKSAANTFFNKPEVIKYIEKKEKDLCIRYQNREIINNTAEQTDNVNLATAPRDKVNEVLIERLENVIKDPNSTSGDVISAVNKIADIRNSKEKEDETDNSAYSKFMHFVVPMQCCDECPNKDNLLKDNNHFATEEEVRQAFYKNDIQKK